MRKQKKAPNKRFTIHVQQLDDVFVSRLVEFGLAVIAADGPEPDLCSDEHLTLAYFVEEKDLGWMLCWLSHIAHKLSPRLGRFAVEALAPEWMPRISDNPVPDVPV